jgi:REase associating with pPIWI_RE/pPIWI_RE three-gene island domain Y
MGTGQQQEDAVVTIRLLAKGIVEIARRIADGAIVRQDDMPSSLRSGLERLSRHCLVEGVADHGANVHVLMDLATIPIGEWGIPSFSGDFPYVHAVLIDRDLGMPSGDCFEIGSISNAEDAYEDIHHRQLREAVRSHGKRADEVYTLVRGRLVRSPVDNQKELMAFLLDNGLAKISDVFRSWMRPIPLACRFPDGKVRTCAGCGSLLYPTRDTARFPVGRCRIRACTDDSPTPREGLIIDDPQEWRVASSDILASWLGPGLPEIKLFDELNNRGVPVRLYPGQDAVDVGIPYDLGIDVKSYSCPVTLGERLTRSIGGLAQFDKRIVAVPDAKVRRHAGYLSDLRHHYRGDQSVEFHTVSETLELLSG